MSKKRILVVEDDFDISNMLRIYFSGQGYEVNVAPRGGDALTMTRKQQPNLILLDIMLPDMNGYDVCRELRTATRTRNIPIIFLTQKDERADKMTGLSLGADDYIVKPFDIEELKLRVQNSINAVERNKEIDPRSGLATGRMIEDHLRELMRKTDNHWAYIDMKLSYFNEFRDVYGFPAGDDVIRNMSMVMNEAINELGTGDDFLGHPANDNFLIITHAEDAKKIKERITEKFNEAVKQHYSFIDRERGYMLAPQGNSEKQVPLMSLSVGMVSTATYQFSDIREVTEMAAEDRRRGSSGESGTFEPIETAW
jgi:PleD family two-component response regulator